MEGESKKAPYLNWKTRISKLGTAEVALILLAMLGLVGFVILNTTKPGWDFRNNLWAPSYLLLQGKSPYNLKVLFDLGRAVWLPMVIGAFFPLGFLPLQQASNLWLAVNSLGVIFLIWLSSGFRRPPILKLTIATIASFIFFPLISHLRLGQFSIGITLLFLVVVIWNDKLPAILSALLLAIALSKPQLAIFVLPGFLFSSYQKNGARDTLQGIGLLLACILILMIPLFVVQPDWYIDFINTFQENPAWKHPSTLVVLTDLTKSFGLYIWMGFALIMFIINIRIWAVQFNRTAVLWSLALTPLVTPYVWSWDFVMILPLFVAMLFQVKSRAFWILVFGYLLCWLLMLRTALGSEVSDDLYWYVSWIMVGTIVCTTLADKGTVFNQELRYAQDGREISS